MTKEASPGTDAGSGAAAADNAAGQEGAAGVADTLEQDLEAMRLAEMDDGADDDAGAGAQAGAADKAAEAGDQAGAAGDDAAGADAGGKTPLTVDEINKRWQDQKAATRQERQARQASEAELGNLRRELQELRARMSGGQEGPPQARQSDNPLDIEIPDPEQDPEGAFKAAIAYAKAQRAAQLEQNKADDAATQQQQALRSLVTEFQRAEQEYLGVQPDYNEAVTFMRDNRMAELELFGQSPEQAAQTFRREVLQLVAGALRTDQHPAHIVYQMAKHRGYAGPKPATPDPEKETAAMDRRIQAEKLSRSVSGPGGKAASTGPTVEGVNAIEDGDAFDKAFDELARAHGLSL
ncbi:MAG: hypothetical protein KDA53_12660 [Hyphomonas sp.]|nr:hypothetical protein [Hyphomonas sp.]